MKGVLLKEFNKVADECDIVLFFEDKKSVEVNFMRRGNTLFVWVEGCESLKLRLQDE